MKQLVPVFFIILFCHAANAQSSSGGIIINDVSIISADEKKVNLYTGYVVIKGDKIVYAGKRKPGMTEAYGQIDGKGKFLIPGLIDGHVHTGKVLGFMGKHYKKYPEMVSDYLRQEPKSYLYFGFTTLVDLGEWKDNNHQYYNKDITPNLLGIGQTIRQFDGYGHNFYAKPEGYSEMANWVFNPEQVSQIPKEFNLAEHTAPKAVQNAKDAGAIAVKTFYEDGFSGVINGLQLPSDSLLAEIVEKAHLQNLPVLLHATSVLGYKKGLQCGVDIFAHGLWHFEKGNFLSTGPPEYLEVEDLIEQIVQKNICVQPTMRVVLAEKDIYTGKLLNHPDIKHALPPNFLSWFETAEGKWGQEDLNETLEALKPDKSISNEAYIDSLQKRVYSMLALMNAKAVKFIFGTDTPTPHTGLGAVTGLNGWLELQAMKKAGLSLKEIFLAVTYRNAAAMKLDKIIGSVEKGKQADLLILNSNPLKDINAYNDIEFVIIRGKKVKRTELSATRR